VNNVTSRVCPSQQDTSHLSNRKRAAAAAAAGGGGGGGGSGSTEPRGSYVPCYGMLL